MMRKLVAIFLFLSTTGTASAQSWSIYYDSTAFFWAKDWPKTISLLEKSLSLAEKEIGREHPNYAILLNDLGLGYWHTGNFQLAESTLDRSLRLKKVSLGEKDSEYTATLLNIAGMMHAMNRKGKAESLYLQVLDQYKESNVKDAYYTATLNNLGNLYEEEANYGLAEKQYLKAMAHKAETVGKEHSSYAKTLNNLGTLYQKIGKIKEAEAYYSKALEIYEKNNDLSINYADALSAFGLLQAEKGMFGDAEKLLNNAKNTIAQNQGTQTKAYASSLNNLGSLFLRMGNKKSAESHYENALTLYMEIVEEGSPDMAAAFNNLAGYYVGEQDFDKALPLYLKAKEIYSNYYSTKHPLYASALNNLASLYRKLHDYEQAEQYYLEVLNIEKEVLGEQHPQYAASLQNMGLLAIAMGNLKVAANYMHQAVAIKQALLSAQHPSWATTYNNLGLLYFLQDDLKTAGPFFEKALNNQFHQIKNVFPALSEKEKEIFYNTLKDDIERFNTFALERYKEDPAMAGIMYNNQLVTKGLLFDASTKVRESIFQSENPTLIEKYNHWRALRDQLSRAYYLTKDVLESRNIVIRDLEEEVNVLEKELSESAFQLNPQSDWQTLSWQGIRDKLAPEEAAIEIVRFREFMIAPQRENTADTDQEIQAELLYGWTEKIHYAALIITPETQDHPKLILLKEGESLESKYFSYYKNAMRYQIEDSLSFQHYWNDIQEALKGIKTVYFSPDGAYYKINLNTLLDPSNGTYLLDHLQIKQLTSTRDLLLSPGKENNGAKKDAVLIGAPQFNYILEKQVLVADDKGMGILGKPIVRQSGTKPSLTIIELPGTKVEVEKINTILSNNHWETEKLLHEYALEKSIKTVNSPKVLHIATHGYFKDTPEKQGEAGKNPLLNSGLLFTGAQQAFKQQDNLFYPNPREEDGILTAFEAMNLKLDQTDLVVLSACETGSGTVKNGEGVYGLQRAFQVAGASSIIFSLWKVNDAATQKLMEYFYADWMKTDNKRAAFTAAQQKLREEYPHSYYWGAFILIGD